MFKSSVYDYQKSFLNQSFQIFVCLNLANISMQQTLLQTTVSHRVAFVRVLFSIYRYAARDTQCGWQLITKKNNKPLQPQQGARVSLASEMLAAP